MSTLFLVKSGLFYSIANAIFTVFMRIKLAITVAAAFAIHGCANTEEAESVKKVQTPNNRKKRDESSSGGFEGGGSGGGSGGGQGGTEEQSSGGQAGAGTRDQGGDGGQVGGQAGGHVGAGHVGGGPVGGHVGGGHLGGAKVVGHAGGTFGGGQVGGRQGGTQGQAGGGLGGTNVQAVSGGQIGQAGGHVAGGQSNTVRQAVGGLGAQSTGQGSTGGQVNGEQRVRGLDGGQGGTEDQAGARDRIGAVGQTVSRDHGVTVHQAGGGLGAPTGGGMDGTGAQVNGGQRVEGLGGQVKGGQGSGPSGQVESRSSVGGKISSSGGPVGRGVDQPTQLGLGNFDSKDFTHIVVIPDVHGDADFFIHSLWIAFNKIESEPIAELRFKNKLIAVANGVVFPSGRSNVVPDKPLSVLGKRAAIVQLGDIMDRGPQSLFSYKILASIETAIGWKLIQLFGNHELMIYNPGADGGFDLRYNNDPTDISNEEAKKLFAPGGALRDYILSKNLIVARIGTPPDPSVQYRPNPASPDTLFVHANVDLKWAAYFLRSIEKNTSQKSGDWLEFVSLLNSRKREEFKRQPSSTAALGNDDDGPLFTRGIPKPKYPETRERHCALLEDFMGRIHVSRVIVGHTPDSDNHTTRVFCGNKFIIADVAMSRSMSTNRDGQPYALIMNLSNGGTSISSITAHYDHYLYHDVAHRRQEDFSASR